MERPRGSQCVGSAMSVVESEQVHVLMAVDVVAVDLSFVNVIVVAVAVVIVPAVVMIFVESPVADFAHLHSAVAVFEYVAEWMDRTCRSFCHGSDAVYLVSIVHVVVVLVVVVVAWSVSIEYCCYCCLMLLLVYLPQVVVPEFVGDTMVHLKHPFDVMCYDPVVGVTPYGKMCVPHTVDDDKWVRPPPPVGNTPWSVP